MRTNAKEAKTPAATAQSLTEPINVPTHLYEGASPAKRAITQAGAETA